MIKIGLLSDTHNYIDKLLFDFFNDCDEIWHAGDIGSMELADRIKKFKPLKAVYGNIDGNDVRSVYSKHLRFKCENVDVWITHIGGYPKKYDQSIKQEIKENPPDLFISGHSHILKIMYDNELNLLHINPGAAGKSGLHKFQTAVRFHINDSEIQNLEIFEYKRS
jgi:putative phosphoesterase